MRYFIELKDRNNAINTIKCFTVIADSKEGAKEKAFKKCKKINYLCEIINITKLEYYESNHFTREAI